MRSFKSTAPLTGIFALVLLCVHASSASAEQNTALTAPSLPPTTTLTVPVLTVPTLSVPSFPVLSGASAVTSTSPTTLPPAPTLTVPTLSVPTLPTPSLQTPTLPKLEVPTLETPKLEVPELPALSVPTLPAPALPALPQQGGSVAAATTGSSGANAPVSSGTGGQSTPEQLLDVLRSGQSATPIELVPPQEANAGSGKIPVQGLAFAGAGSLLFFAAVSLFRRRPTEPAA